MNALRDQMADGDPVELSRGTRRALAIVTALAGGVALTHHLLTSALEVAHGTGLMGAVCALLTWPLPLTQPALAGVSALALSVIGMQTEGWRQVTPRQRWHLTGFTIAAVLGAGPMILLCAVTFAVFTLAIGIALIVGVGLLALLILKR